MSYRQSKPIFSGDYSVKMWAAINEATTITHLRRALYFVCCRLQELEARVSYSHNKRKKAIRTVRVFNGKTKFKKGHQGGAK